MPASAVPLPTNHRVAEVADSVVVDAAGNSDGHAFGFVSSGLPHGRERSWMRLDLHRTQDHQMSHRFPGQLALACVALLGFAGCGGEHMKLVGTYSREEQQQAGPGGDWVHERATLTLREDNRWTMLREATINGRPLVSAPDSGSYGVDGVNLVMRSPDSGVWRYIVSGDTLWSNMAADVALTKAVTGIDMGGSGEERGAYLVRNR